MLQIDQPPQPVDNRHNSEHATNVTGNPPDRTPGAGDAVDCRDDVWWEGIVVTFIDKRSMSMLAGSQSMIHDGVGRVRPEGTAVGATAIPNVELLNGSHRRDDLPRGYDGASCGSGVAYDAG